MGDGEQSRASLPEEDLVRLNRRRGDGDVLCDEESATSDEKPRLHILDSDYGGCVFCHRPDSWGHLRADFFLLFA